jgi:hypothetical protein
LDDRIPAGEKGIVQPISVEVVDFYFQTNLSINNLRQRIKRQ